MNVSMRCACVLLWTTTVLAAQQPQTSPAPVKTGHPAAPSALEKTLAGRVTAEWEAFKNRDKKGYSDLLADDFAAVEDDNQGMRTKTAAAGEVDRSVINSYNLYALKATPLGEGAALVTYELTMLFPPKATIRFKRVLVGELWVKREGQWKLRYYQETHVR